MHVQSGLSSGLYLLSCWRKPTAIRKMGTHLDAGWSSSYNWDELSPLIQVISPFLWPGQITRSGGKIYRHHVWGGSSPPCLVTSAKGSSHGKEDLCGTVARTKHLGSAARHDHRRVERGVKRKWRSGHGLFGSFEALFEAPFLSVASITKSCCVSTVLKTVQVYLYDSYKALVYKFNI